MSESNQKGGWVGLIAAPFQFLLAFVVSILLIAGVGYGSGWIVEEKCIICTTSSDLAPDETSEQTPAPEESDESKETPEVQKEEPESPSPAE